MTLRTLSVLLLAAVLASFAGGCGHGAGGKIATDTALIPYVPPEDPADDEEDEDEEDEGDEDEADADES